MRSLLPAVLLLVAWMSAAAQTSTPTLSVTDTMFTAGLELRGLVDLPRGETLALMTAPDTLAEFSTRSAHLVWTDDDGRRVKEHEVSGVLTHGLAFDGKWLWGIGPDPETGIAGLVQLESDSLYVKDVYPLPGHRPVDVSWGEAHVWLVDRDDGSIHKVDPETGKVRQSYLTPGFSPCGIAHDGRALWVNDFATGRLYRMSKDGRKLRSTLTLDSYRHRAESVMLFWADDVLWLAPDGAGHVLRGRIN